MLDDPPDLRLAPKRSVFLAGRQPSLLVVAAKWWPLSARMAMALLRHGCRVSALCPAGHPLTHISGLERTLRYDPMHSWESLREALSDGPDIVIPCDDGVVAQLHALHRLEPQLRALIERSLGAADSYPIVSRRYEFLRTAAELGIQVPTTIRVRSSDDVVAWHKDVAPAGVLKVDGESGGNGVKISRSLEESLAAWLKLSRGSSVIGAWKRLTIDRDPLALWACRNAPQHEVTLQRFIPGRPANSMMACLCGEVLSQLAVAVLAADGPTGAAMVVRRVQDERMAQAARLLAKRLNLSGFYGLDFMIEADSRIPYLIEMNPRCTQLGHLEFSREGSLAGAFAAALRNETLARTEHPIAGDTIAFFPVAVAASGDHHRLIDSSYLDVPWEEPGLVAELKRRPWPQRRWAARLYHSLRPVRRMESVEFDP